MSERSPSDLQAIARSRARVERTGEITAKREKRERGRKYTALEMVQDRANNDLVIEKMAPYSELEVVHDRVDENRTQTIIRGRFKGIDLRVTMTREISGGYRYKYTAKIGNKKCDPVVSEKIYHALDEKIRRLKEAKKYEKDVQALDDEPDPSPSGTIEDILGND